MKTLTTEILVILASAMLIAAIICLDKTMGIIAMGIYVFCYVASADLRRRF